MQAMGTFETSAFRRWVCQRKLLWTGVLTFVLVNLLLGLLVITSIERGSATYVVLMMDFALIAVMLVILGLVFWRCGYLNN